ncbi:MAG: hypothetical protein NVSMB24_27820 [Mucilaginibacter sp.]
MDDQSEILAIGAIPFIIDRDRRLLQQFNKRENIIRFDHLKKEEGYYAAKLYKSGINLSTEWPDFSKHYDQILNVIIPAPILDEHGSLTEDFKQDLNRLSHDKEWGFYLANKDTALRLSGKLPHIDLAGTDFTIDWRLKELRETEEPWKNISLRDMEMSDSGEDYLCFYNTETHELYEPDENLLELPENVVVLEIPCEAKLDPVAVAREYGIGETDLLNDHPFQMNLKAKVTPLSETGLPEYIQNNKRLAAGNSLNNETQSHKRGR